MEGSASNKRGIGRVEGISHLQLFYAMPFVGFFVRTLGKGD